MVWRGPMVTQALEQLLKDTRWRELDYLVVDLPPGTGDIQLTLAQKVPVTGVVIVTTPQDIALIDARKGLKMFEKVGIPILGVVENMSYHVCRKCGHESHIFGAGGAERMSREYGTELLGQLPLDEAIRSQADSGKPTVVSDPDGAVAEIDRRIARRCAVKIAESQREMFIDWVAAGLDPVRCTFFVQSHVKQHAEMFLLLPMVAPIGWLERVPTYKEQQEQLKEKDLNTYGGDVCIIPPNSFALARTIEYFRIPRNVLTICLGKSTYARCGIIVNVTPLEPEWEGHVTLEFSNTTPLPARVYANEGVAQVIFIESDEPCETSYRERGGKYQGQKGVTLPRI